MKQYIIERFFPGAGKLTEKDLQGIAENSCKTIREMGSGIKWIRISWKIRCIVCIKPRMKISFESMLEVEDFLSIVWEK